MKKEEIVKNNRDFNHIIQNGKYKKNNEFAIYYMDNKCNKDHYGISVGKKIGNAVKRNYYKRIIRNICDKNKNLYSKGKDYIIIVRKGIISLNYQEISDSYTDLFKQINYRKGNEYEEKSKV